MRDCKAARGVFVRPSGWTSGAAQRAWDAITITVLSSEDIDKFDFNFEPCLIEECRAGTVEARRGAVLWKEFVPSG